MSTKTPEPRKRTRLQIGDNAPSPDTTTTSDAPDIVKLRAVLAMLAEGRTYREIAAHFGKNERTIRRWATEARRRQVAILRSYDAEAQRVVVADRGAASDADEQPRSGRRREAGRASSTAPSAGRRQLLRSQLGFDEGAKPVDAGLRRLFGGIEHQVGIHRRLIGSTRRRFEE